MNLASGVDLGIRHLLLVLGTRGPKRYRLPVARQWPRSQAQRLSLRTLCQFLIAGMSFDLRPAVEVVPTLASMLGPLSLDLASNLLGVT